MIRRFADRSDWKRVVERRFEVAVVETAEFDGHITRLEIRRVTAPLYKSIDGHDYCLADAGHIWLQHFPRNGRHTLTTMFDTSGTIVQWYIDVCSQLGVDCRGIPWFDDLYLDIVVLPSGEAYLLDVEELSEALHVGLIGPREYDLAWREAERLLDDIHRGSMSLLSRAADDLRVYFAYIGPPLTGRSPAERT